MFDRFHIVPSIGSAAVAAHGRGTSIFRKCSSIAHGIRISSAPLFVSAALERGSAGDACRADRASRRSMRSRRPSSSSRSFTPLRRRSSRRLAHQVQDRHDARARAARLPTASQRDRAEICISSAKSRSSSACGRSCSRPRWRHRSAGRRRPTTSTTPSTTPNRSSSSSSWRWPRRGRSSALPKAACGRSPRIGGATPAAWWLAILIVGPLLGSFITEPAAMTICALLLSRQFFDLEPEPPVEVRDARSAVRQRVDRRHADALRGAAGADGGARLGMGHAVHAEPLRLARRGCRRRVDARLLPVFRRELRRSPTRPAVPDVDDRKTRRPPSAARCFPCPGWLTVVHVVFMAWTV